jgi:hypothetical protein
VADTSDDLSLTLAGFGRLPEPAKQKLSELVRKYGTEILAEASRLEERWRTDETGEPEITARDVADAAVVVQRTPHVKPTRRGRLLDLTAFAAAFIGGVFGNNIATPVGAVGFAICAGVGIAAYANRGTS